MIHNCVKRRKPLKIRIVEGVAHIEVHGETFMMNAEDIHLLDGWTLNLSGGYVCLRGTPVEKPIFTAKLARVILNAPPDMFADHINGNGLDNRRSNLRLCTRAENNRNKAKQSNGKGPYKGCSCDKRDGKWVAQICVNRTFHYIGRFSTPEAAATAYNIKARELFGEFARINPVNGAQSAAL